VHGADDAEDAVAGKCRGCSGKEGGRAAGQNFGGEVDGRRGGSWWVGL